MVPGKRKVKPGPRPSRGDRVFDPTKPAVVYAFRLRVPQGGRSIYKVGYTDNPQKRLSALNAGVRTAVTGWKYEAAQVEFPEFPNADAAYDAEQMAHDLLQGYEIDSEHFETSLSEVLTALELIVL